MGSLYLNRLDRDARAALIKQLWTQQSKRCFISDCEIDLDLHDVDIDHIVPLRDAGEDHPSNFALTLATYNRSKQASDLRVARVLARLENMKAHAESDDRGVNLNDVLSSFGGSSKNLKLKIDGEYITFVPKSDGESVQPVRMPLYEDRLSKMKYFFACLPIEVLHHDDRINPRPIGPNIRGLIEEFHKGRPQLHVALGWVEVKDNRESTVRVFDGQHKVAAQVLLGVRDVPVRVFVDPDEELLLTANTNAGTTLRQVAFDKSVQRRLGSSILNNRIERFREEKGMPNSYEEFSERTLVDHFKGEQRAMSRYVLDSVRDTITHSPENKLRDFIEYAGKGYEKPLSYSAIEKTFYSQFIFGGMLETPWNHKSQIGENPRELEKAQLIRLMSLIAERIYIGKYDDEIGTRRIENRIQSGESIPEPHLRAFRMAKEEILYAWIGYVKTIVEHHFVHMGKRINGEHIFQYPLPDQLWSNIENFIENLARLPLWVSRPLSETVFGSKQTYRYWQTIFETGSSPSGQRVMTGGLNIMDMIKT